MTQPRGVQDRAEQYIEALGAVTQVLAAADTVEEAVPQLLPALGGALGWDVASWWVVDDGVLHRRAVWSRPGVDAGEFEEDGLPAQVLESRRAVMTEGRICLPVMNRDHARGAIEFFSRTPRPLDEQVARLMESLTTQVGRFFAVLDERAAAMAKLASMALTDELTGLANRRAWEDGWSARSPARGATAATSAWR
jgi:hypothetical protein